jgi:hypothetical protein
MLFDYKAERAITERHRRAEGALTVTSRWTCGSRRAIVARRWHTLGTGAAHDMLDQIHSGLPSIDVHLTAFSAWLVRHAQIVHTRRANPSFTVGFRCGVALFCP